MLVLYNSNYENSEEIETGNTFIDRDTPRTTKLL